MTRAFVFRLLAVLAYFSTLMVIGTIGYLGIERWSLGDSIYMTAITVTAVGYQEVHPLTNPGRVFTMGLLAFGVTGLGMWFALITSLVVEFDLTDTFRKRRYMKRIEELRNHVIICGGGRTGRQVVSDFLRSGQPFVVIEKNPARVKQVTEEHGEVFVIEGDATHDHSLEAAGVARAKGLVAALSADTDNLFVSLSARHLNPNLTIVARAFEEESTAKMYRAGANHVVSPNVSGAHYMASVLLRPSVVSFLDVATRGEGPDLRLEQVRIGNESKLVGKTLADARIPQATGLIVIGVRKEGTSGPDVAFNPQGGTLIEGGDQLIVLGRPDQLEKLEEHLQ